MSAGPTQVAVAYTREQRGVLRTAARLIKKGHGSQAEVLLAQHHMGTADILLLDGQLPEEWTGEVLVDLATAAALAESGRIEALSDFLATRPFDEFEVLAAMRSGCLPEPTRPEPAPPAPAPAAALAKSPAPQRPPLPAHVRILTLPDGTDTRMPAVRARAEAKVREAWGPGWVPMWPRLPDIEDGAAAEVLVVDARPRQCTQRLGDATKPTDSQRVTVEGERAGLGVLVEFDPYVRNAVFAHLPPDTRAVRDRLAALMKTEPHLVEVVCHDVHDDRLGARRLDQVVVLRYPTQSISPEKRAQVWGDLLSALPGGSTGWEVLDNAVTGVVRLRYGKPRVLPDLVAMSDLVPDTMRPQEWNRLPLGISPEGREVGIDLAAGPHAIIAGPTGSGKTIALLQLVVSALSRGHRVIMVDPTKAGLDFLRVRDWCSGWADTLAAGQATIEAVYAEVARRKAILQQYGEVKWSDLPREAREQHGVHPTLVVIDEFGSLVIPEDVPKSLPKDHAFRLEAEERNVSRAIISSLVGRIAREARFAGIHLAIALQRPDASIIGGELRSNLTSAVQLAPPGKPLSLDALRMVFPGDVAPQAAETLAELDDGTSRGLAVMASEGGTAAGFRVAYAPAVEIPDLLECIGIPKPPPFLVHASKTASAPERDGEIIPAVEDLGIMEISLDDLEGGPVQPKGLWE